MSNTPSELVEVIQGKSYPGKLYWYCGLNPPSNTPNAFYFSIDTVTITQQLVYEAFCADFGPVDLGMTYRFCTELEKSLNCAEFEDSKLFHYTSLSFDKRANAAFLMGAFQILVLGRSADNAWLPFSKLSPFRPFRDASRGACSYNCTVLHCLKGLERAVAHGWFNLRSYKIEAYEFNKCLENGDFNWIIPGKMIAFSCPAIEPFDRNGFRTWTPEDYSPVFKLIGVTAVVRLNDETYDSQRFIENDIKHKELFYVDGSCPSDQIIDDFLKFAENEPGAIAIHCKAGLGRTGTLIGCYAMKHFNFPAQEFIGWIRICRPGSVLGPQQHFLVEMETRCRLMGKEHRQSKLKVQVARYIDDLDTASAMMSPADLYKREYGDFQQAENLLKAKKRSRRFSQDCRTSASKTYEPQSAKLLPYRRGSDASGSPI